MLLAFAGSAIIGIAETFLYMRHLTGYDKKPEKKERKARRRSSTASTNTASNRVAASAKYYHDRKLYSQF